MRGLEHSNRELTQFVAEALRCDDKELGSPDSDRVDDVNFDQIDELNKHKSRLRFLFNDLHSKEERIECSLCA